MSRDTRHENPDLMSREERFRRLKESWEQRAGHGFPAGPRVNPSFLDETKYEPEVEDKFLHPAEGRSRLEQIRLAWELRREERENT